MIQFRHIIFILLCACYMTSSHADQLIIEPDAGRAPLLSAIKHAKDSVQLAIYGLTDKAFIDALIDAHDAYKNVQVLLEPAPYKNEAENHRAIQQLRSANINLKEGSPYFQLLHQKTFIIDHRRAIVMTFNLTHSAFLDQRNFALVIDNPSELNEINNVFAADFAHKSIVPQHPDLLWSPNNSRKKIIEWIGSAHSSIKIYAENITDYQTIGALANAARHGVHIEILVSVNPEQLHSKKFAYLERAGVTIHNSQHFIIHAKVILIDDKKALLGSVNLTKPSLEMNRELSVITQDATVVHQLVNTFKTDWDATLNK